MAKTLSLYEFYEFFHSIKQQVYYVMAVERSPDGEQIVSCTADKTLRLWRGSEFKIQSEEIRNGRSAGPMAQSLTD
jgi:WD40 repeat protein